jgi:hypothetical protein
MEWRMSKEAGGNRGRGVTRLARATVVAIVAVLLASCGPSAGGGPAAGHTAAMRNGMDVRRPVMPDVGMGGGHTRVPPGRDETGPGPSGPPAAIVPDVRGLVFERAVHRLWRSGIDFGLVFARQSPGRLWSVVQEDPPPGADTPRFGKINLVVAIPHMHGATVNGTVRCKPEADELDDPYCLGKLFKY